jgi:HEAT repeat protein
MSADWSERLGSEDRSVQRRACDAACREIETDPGLRTKLRDLLRTGSPRARFAAAWVLVRCEPPGLRVLPALLDALELPDGDLRWSAAHMLAALGRTQPEVFAVLLQEAGDASRPPERRRMLLYALRELGPDRPETVALLLAALADPAADVRRAALSSFGKLLEPDRACLERALEIAAADPDVKLRRIAVTVMPDLAEHHPDLAARVAERLADLSNAEDGLLARAARGAARRLGGGTAPRQVANRDS